MTLPLPGSPAVAVADQNGAASFSFPPPAALQVFTGTLSVNNAPGSAVFEVVVGGQPVGSWIGTNGYGPVQTSQGVPLTVTAKGLQPGVQYECAYTGQLTEGTDLDAIPDAQTSIVQPPNAILLGTDTATAHLVRIHDIELDTSWRALWLVATEAAGVATIVTGDQSGLTYEPLSPPYFAGGLFQRYALLAGVDTSVTLQITAGASPLTFWWGGDLADVDVAVYGTSGGTFPANYALEVGGHLQDIDDTLLTVFDGGVQVAYPDSDTTITLATGLLMMGSQGSSPGTSVPGNARVIQTDSVGRLVISPTSPATSVDATIVSPLDGSGWVEVDVKTSVLPTNAAEETGGNLATIASVVEVISGVHTARVQPADANGNPWDAVTSGAINGGELAVVVDGTLGNLPPFASTPTFNLGQVVGQTLHPVPADAVYVAGSDGATLRAIPVSVATAATPSSTVIVGGADGSVNTQRLGVGVPGALTPGTALLVGGTDGTDLRAILTDSTGRASVILPTVSAASGTALPADGVLVGGSDGTDLRYLSTDTSGRVNVTVQLAQGATAAAVPAQAVFIGGTDGTNVRAIATDTSGQVKVLVENTPAVTISGQPIEVKGGSVTSISVYPIGGTSQAVVTCTATTLTAFVSAPSAGTAYRIISITAIGTGGAASTAFWAVGNSALTATIAAANVIPSTVLLNGQLWIPAYGSIDAKISGSTPNVLFTMYYDVISTATIT